MKSKNRQQQSRYDEQLRHRINAGRVAIRNQISFFSRQFGQVSSEWKPDETRVTFADFAISEKLITELNRDFTKDNFCSEEANPLDEVMQLDADFAWIIDPVDGTNNYALGFPLCAISLALLYQGEPVYGFIYDHSTGELIEGGPGFGVLREQKKLEDANRTPREQIIIGCHFPLSKTQLEGLGSILQQYRIRSFGSSALMFTHIATGYLSGAIDYRVKVWDIAAAFAICQGHRFTFRFIDSSPFPLKTFHPSDDLCPCYCGTIETCNEFEKAIRLTSDAVNRNNS
ncbi:MAG: inositol monophosphatase family protein [Coraliomargaritaceae bacterium]